MPLTGPQKNNLVNSIKTKGHHPCTHDGYKKYTDIKHKKKNSQESQMTINQTH